MATTKWGKSQVCPCGALRVGLESTVSLNFRLLLLCCVFCNRIGTDPSFFVLFMTTCRGDSYCKTLEGLIQIAPPPQKNYPFGTNFSQTILVTQYFQPSPTPKRQQHTLDDSDEDDSEDGCDSDTNAYGYHQHDREEEEGETDQQDSDVEGSRQDKNDPQDDDDDDNSSTGSTGIRPWPPEHSKFMDSSLVQEHLALEIASGGGRSQRPKDIQKGNVRIVIPGSLRERGEFCLVDMSLMEKVVMKSMAAAATVSTASPPMKKKSFAWSVRNVEFHNMERLP